MLQSLHSPLLKNNYSRLLFHLRHCQQHGWDWKKIRNSEKSFHKFKYEVTEKKLTDKLRFLDQNFDIRYKRPKFDSSRRLRQFGRYDAIFESNNDRSLIGKICDLRKPADWYPEARSVKRSIIFHAGPTNSGKTHSALERFLSSTSGIYCCPLRLLAREISQKSKAANVACNLITGEEKHFVQGSKHIACTVEMANFSQKFDIGVIDEIQILADSDRGWAWTQALLGLQANEIHVCGEPRAINIVRRLSAACGDDFKVLEYQRLTKLRVKKYAVGSTDKLRSGDCIVCFKRKDIYNTISELKKQGKDTAVIYGKLPPSTKRIEAKKFNDSQNSCNILVATDAVGMGLNLNIKRIVFQALRKGVRNSKGVIENKQLTPPEALQIAGRAGRYGLQESGEVTTLYREDIHDLHELLSNLKEDIKQAHLLPTRKQFLKFSSQMSDSNLFQVLLNFRKLSKIDKQMYVMSSQRDCLILAESMQRFKLPLPDAYTFSLCPINSDSEICKGMFCQFVKFYSHSKPVTYGTFLKLLQKKFSIKFPILAEIEYHKIAILEDVHNTIGAYLWLAHKFPKYFPDQEKIFRLQQTTVDAITLSLRNVRMKPSPQYKREFKQKTKIIRQKIKPVIFYR